MAAIELDPIDLKILAELQADARITNAELADRVGLSASPCLRRVKRLEEAGVVAGYRAVFDRAAVGLGLTVFVDIKVGWHSRDNAQSLQDALLGMPEVVACYMLSGDTDFQAEVVVADLAAYERFLTDKLLTLPMVEDIRSKLAIRMVKTDGPLPIRRR